MTVHTSQNGPAVRALARARLLERAAALENTRPLDSVVSFRGGMQLRLGGREIELIYVDDIYNPGDIAIWLPKEGVMHGGFAGCIDRYPDIRPDYSHGTTEGLIKQLDVLMTLNPKVVVPAHGPLGSARDLQATMLLKSPCSAKIEGNCVAHYVVCRSVWSCHHLDRKLSRDTFAATPLEHFSASGWTREADKTHPPDL